jgi:hypothetical protein
MKSNLRITGIILLLLYSSHALGLKKQNSDDVWTSGKAQGVCGAEVTNGSANKIYVSCNCGSGFENEISILIENSTPKKNVDILMAFDDSAPISVAYPKDGIVADSKKGKANFKKLLTLFKKHSRVKIELPNGKFASFTLKGSTAALKGCQRDN